MPDDYKEIKESILKLETDLRLMFVDSMTSTKEMMKESIDSIRAIVKDLSGDTKDNSMLLQTLKADNENNIKDIDTVADQNRKQHEEFYTRLGIIQNQLTGYKYSLMLLSVLFTIALGVLKLWT